MLCVCFPTGMFFFSHSLEIYLSYWPSCTHCQGHGNAGPALENEDPLKSYIPLLPIIPPGFFSPLKGYTTYLCPFKHLTTNFTLLFDHLCGLMGKKKNSNREFLFRKYTFASWLLHFLTTCPRANHSSFHNCKMELIIAPTPIFFTKFFISLSGCVCEYCKTQYKLWVIEVINVAVFPNVI